MDGAIDQDPPPEVVEQMIKDHLVTIVNALRGNATPHNVAVWLRVPEWLVERIGKDAGLL